MAVAEIKRPTVDPYAPADRRATLIAAGHPGLGGNPSSRRETEPISRSRLYIQLTDFNNTDGAGNDAFSPNKVTLATWKVHKRNNPDTYRFKHPDLQDDTIVGLRPFNAAYRAWSYARDVRELGEQYVMNLVCDPGVGGKREGIVIETKEGNYLIGPNNGVFGRVLEDEGIAVEENGRLKVWKVRDEIFDDVETATFHGKDVFAPLSQELLDGKSPNTLTDWLVPFDGQVRLNPFSGDFRSLVPEHVAGSEIEQVYIPGDLQRLMENDGVRLLRFDGHVPPDAIALRAIIPNRDTLAPEKVVVIPVGESFVDQGPGTLMAYPGSENRSGVRGGGYTEIAASMAVHNGEPNAVSQLGLSFKDVGHPVIFQWLRAGDDLTDTSFEAISSYQWEDRGLPERVLDDDGTVRVVYRTRERIRPLTIFDFDTREGSRDLIHDEVAAAFAHIIGKDRLNGRAPVIYIDGLTGSGKTTVLELLQNALPGVHVASETVDTIPEEYRNTGAADSLLGRFAAQLWWLRQYENKDRRLKEVPHDQPVLVDRGPIGIVPYSDFLDPTGQITQGILKLAQTHDWLPGHHIFLTARPDVIQARLGGSTGRNRLSREEWEAGQGAFITSLHASVAAIAERAGITVIDTSDLTPEQVAFKILAVQAGLASRSINDRSEIDGEIN